MTESEALKEIIEENNMRINNIKYWINTNSSANYSNCHRNIKKFEITNKAVEKQIPKKLIRRRATDDDVENELRDFITCKGEICRCPACGDCIAIYELKYCMECGQRLDWGTESEG